MQTLKFDAAAPADDSNRGDESKAFDYWYNVWLSRPATWPVCDDWLAYVNPWERDTAARLPPPALVYFELNSWADRTPVTGAYKAPAPEWANNADARVKQAAQFISTDDYCVSTGGALAITPTGVYASFNDFPQAGDTEQHALPNAAHLGVLLDQIAYNGIYALIQGYAQLRYAAVPPRGRTARFAAIRRLGSAHALGLQMAWYGIGQMSSNGDNQRLIDLQHWLSAAPDHANYDAAVAYLDAWYNATLGIVPTIPNDSEEGKRVRLTPAQRAYCELFDYDGIKFLPLAPVAPGFECQIPENLRYTLTVLVWECEGFY